MTYRHTYFAVVFVTVCSISSASLLEWFTGFPQAEGSRYGHQGSVFGYPEESGECSHWGDVDMKTLPHQNPLLHSPGELIASHRSAPVGSLVSVTNMRNGNTITVRVVSPRSTPVFGRVMDLSPAAFSQLENVGEGVFTCSAKILQKGRPEMSSAMAYNFEGGRNPERPSHLEFPIAEASSYASYPNRGSVGSSASLFDRLPGVNAYYPPTI